MRSNFPFFGGRFLFHFFGFKVNQPGDVDFGLLISQKSADKI